MRVAIITHAFPPSRHANGKRPYYIAKGLLDAGWEVDVFTSNLGCDRVFTETLAGDRCRVIRVVDPVVKWLDRLKPVRVLYRLGVSAANGLIWPDFYAPWVRRAIKRMRKEGGYDRVLAFVFPPSMYLTAKVNDLVDQSWTFDLQESVTPQYRKFPRRSPFQRLLHPRFERLEQKALHQAGRVVFTADTNRRAYIDAGLVPETTSEHVPYFFDARVFGSGTPDEIEGFNICYFGTFDWRGSRSPEVFLNALAAFLKKHPDARGRTKFVFYGVWHPEHNAIVGSLGLEDVVDIREAVPYGEYLEKVRSAPMLLLVVSSEHNLFMPSKIVDYFGARRPILAYVPEGSEMRHVLDEAGMAEQAVGEIDAEGGARAIESLWMRYASGGFGDLEANTGFWSSDVQVSRYVELLENRN